jgi:hypothetical protein
MVWLVMTHTNYVKRDDFQYNMTKSSALQVVDGVSEQVNFVLLTIFLSLLKDFEKLIFEPYRACVLEMGLI